MKRLRIAKAYLANQYQESSEKDDLEDCARMAIQFYEKKQDFDTSTNIEMLLDGYLDASEGGEKTEAAGDLLHRPEVWKFWIKTGH